MATCRPVSRQKKNSFIHQILMCTTLVSQMLTILLIIIIVQLSTIGTNLKLLHFNQFIEALYEDPDLASIPKPKRAKILQILYISTGCDFTSFFVGIGFGHTRSSWLSPSIQNVRNSPIRYQFFCSR